jgi:hypothetical protein
VSQYLTAWGFDAHMNQYFFLFFAWTHVHITKSINNMNTHSSGTISSSHNHQSYWDFDSITPVQLFAKDGADEDYYGRGLAICGDQIVIGASLDTFKGVQSGTAYLYSRSPGSTYEWNVLGKLYPSLGDDDDHFGWSVACDGNHTIVGAYGDDYYYDNGGAVYLYTQQKDGRFIEESIFYPTSELNNENFGWSVALHGNLIVVGAKGNSELYTQCGAVYIFRRDESSTSTSRNGEDDDSYVPDGWVLDTLLVPDRQSPYMNYGWTVALYKTTLVVGAPRADSSTGYVYVYVRNMTETSINDDQYYSSEAVSYSLVSVLRSPYPQTKSYFGCSVAVYENLIVVGQYLRVVQVTGRELSGGDDDSLYEVTSGGAYVYRRNSINQFGSERYPSSYREQWGAIADLGSLIGYTDYEMFGYSVAVFHDLIAIGAPGDSVVRVNSSLYLFSGNQKDDYLTWTPLTTSGWGEFTNTDRQRGKLGVSLALSEGLVLVGDTECVNSVNELKTGCAYSWWGINHHKGGDDNNPPHIALPLDDSFAPLWISFFVVLSLTSCLVVLFFLHRWCKRDYVEIVLEDMMTGDSEQQRQQQRMPYDDSTRHSRGERENSSHLPDWLHRYSNHTNDWLFGGSEMRPVSPRPWSLPTHLLSLRRFDSAAIWTTQRAVSVQA